MDGMKCVWGRTSRIFGSAFLALSLITGVGSAYGAAGDTFWEQGHAAAGRQEAVASAVDNVGNVVITGYVNSGGANDDYYTVKLKADGTGMVWPAAKTYDRAGGQDMATAVAVDSGGNVIVTGYVWNGNNYDIHTIKYSGDTGAVIWQHTFAGVAGGGDYGTSVTVDSLDNVYVAGYTANASGNDDFILLKYGPDTSAVLWQVTYDGASAGNDRALAVAAGEGGIAVTGYSWSAANFDVLTVKYGYGGAKLWESRYTSAGARDDRGAAVKIDAAGNVIVTGYLSNAVDHDIYLAKYAAANGTASWSYTYQGEGDAEPKALHLDSAGDIFVAGFAWKAASNLDIYAARFLSDGTKKWETTGNSANGDDDTGMGIVTDPGGNAFVTGYSFRQSGANYDFRIMKFGRENGAVLWQRAYTAAADRNEKAVGAGVSPTGGIYAIGWADMWTAGATDFDLYAIHVDPGQLDAPTGLSAVVVSNTAVALSWTDLAGNEDGFRVERKLGEAGTYAEIATVGANITSYNDTGLTPSTRYFYRVRAYNAANGNSAYTNDASVLTLLVTAVAPTWTFTFDDSIMHMDDKATGIAVGPDNHPVVTGESLSRYDGIGQESTNFLTMKIDRGTGTVQWSQLYDDADNAEETEPVIAVDRNNEVIVAGNSDQVLPGGEGSQDIFAMKTLPAGGLEYWTHWFGNNAGADFTKAVVATEDGTNKFYVVGYGINASGNDDIKVLKYNSDGSAAWAGGFKSYDGGGDDRVAAAALDPAGNLVVTGYRTTGGTDRWFTAKFNSANGTIAWSATFDGLGAGPDYAQGIGTDKNGNVYVTGWVRNGGNDDFYTIRYDGVNGGIVWQQPHGGAGNDRGMALKVDPIDDSVVVAGTAYISAGDNDIHVLRYDTNGNQVWEADIERPATDEQVVAMGMDRSGNFTVTGTTGTGTDTDVFSVRYGFDGTLLGMTTAGAAGRTDAPTSIVVNGLGEAFVAGYITAATTFTDFLVYKISSSSLQAPLPLSAVPDYSRIALTWTDNSTNENGYTVQRKLGACTSGNAWVTLAAALPANTVTYTDTLLNPTTSYCYRVRAFKNDGDVSRWGEKVFSTITPTPPGAFTGTVISTTQINLSWTDNTTGEGGFRIERCAGTNCTFSTIDATFTPAANATTYNDTSVCGGESYSYRIVALKGGEWESAPTLLANKIATVPSVPTTPTATRVSEVEINITWSDNATDETGYRIERCAGSGCSDFSEIAVVTADTTSWRDSLCLPNISYTYRVRAYKTATCSWNTPYTADVSATTTSADPSGLAATAANTTQINLSWTDTTGSETGFQVEKCTGAGCNDFAEVTTTAPIVTSWSDTSVCGGTSYSYRLRARNQGLPNGNGGCWTKRKPVTFTNFVPDHQTKVVIAYDADMKTDFSDVRFYDIVAQREIPYWVESRVDGSTMTVWVKPTRSSSVYLYFGNAAATGAGSGPRVFEVFDHFSNLDAWTQSGSTISFSGSVVTLDSGSSPAIYRNFTVPTPFVAEAKYQHPTAYRNRIALTTAAGGGSPTGFDYGVFDNGQLYWNGWTGVTLTANTWYIMRWDNTAASYSWRIFNEAGTEVFTRTHASAIPNLQRFFVAGTDSTSSDIKLDWMRVRKYVATEPATALGAKESDACYSFGVTWDSGYTAVASAIPPVGAIPGGMAASAVSESQINITWTDTNADETGYKLERCTGAACSDFAEIAILTAGTTSYSNIGLLPSTTYRYRVKGYKTTTCSWETDYATASATTVSVPGPSALTVSAPNTTRVNIGWTDNSGSETTFQVERCQGAGCSDFTLIAETAPNATSYSDTLVCNSQPYTYRVRASNQGLSYRNGGCWIRRIPLTIANFQQNFQTKITLAYDADMKADFSDIRFYDITDGRELPYWIESKTNGVSASVVFKTGNNNAVYLYYGNAAATSAASAQAVYEFYEPFAGTTIDSGRWTLANGTYYSQNDEIISSGGPNGWTSAMYSVATFARPFVVEMDHYHTGGNYMMLGIKNNNAGANYTDLLYAIYAIYDGSSRNAVYEDGNQRADNLKVIASGTWQYYKIEVGATGAKYYHGGSPSAYTNIYTSAYSTATPLKLGFANYNQAFRIDNIRMRKYAATDPTVTPGAEETSACFGFNITWDSSFSGTASVTTPTPAAPVLTAARGSESQINLSWTNTTTDESGFKLQRCTGSGCSDFADLATTQTDVITYADVAVAPSTTYTYRVLAYKTASCSWESAYSNSPAATTTTDAPTTLAGTAPNTTTINLTWTDNTGSETGFKVERCLGASCSDFAEIASTAVDATSWSDSGVCYNSTYRYRARAVNTGFSNTGGGCWTRRAPLAVTNFQSNYQTKLVLPYDADMRTDFRDIRFYDTVNQRELPYWIESKADGVNATVWVKTKGTNNVYVYYGNPSATASSNAVTTFEFFDDFAGTTIDPAKWTVVGGTHSQSDELIVSGSTSAWNTGLYSVKNFDRPFVVELQQYFTNWGNLMFGVKNTGTGIVYSNLTYATYISSGTNYVYEDGTSRGSTSTSSPINAWHYYKFEVPPTGAKYYAGASPAAYTKIYDSVYSTASPLKISFSNNNMTFKWDNVKVRKYAAVEPTVAVGAEESSGCFSTATWESPYSNIVNVTTANIAVPTLNSTLGSEVQLNLSWTDGNSDETGFTLQRCSGAGCSNFTDLTTLNANVLSYSDTLVMSQAEYSYRVAAYKTASCSWSTAYSNTATRTTTVTAPSGLGAVTANTTTVNLAWTDNSGAETGYTIERCAGASCSNFSELITVLRNTTTYSDTSVCNTTPYSYRVMARNAGLAASGGGCWTRRVPMTFTNFAPNFQVYMTIPYDADMQTDFDDIRFFDATMNRDLPYWIESKTDGASMKVYFKTGPSSNVFMYYGNSAATSASNAATTFDFYDDFTGAAVDTAKWTVTNGTGFSVSGGMLHGTNTTGRLTSKTSFGAGTVLEIKARSTALATNGQAIGGFYSNGSDNLGWLNHPSNAYYINNGGYVSKPDETPQNNLLYTITQKDASTANLQIYNLDTLAMYWNVGDLAHAGTTKPVVLGYRYDNGYGNQAYITDWDWVRVRKYAAPLPTAALGTEEQDACYTFGGTWTSGYSNTASATTTSPVPPSGLSAVAATDTRINLAWSDTAPDETGFRIERCTGSGCSDFAEVMINAANVTTWADTEVAPSTIYRYRVRTTKAASCAWDTPYTGTVEDKSFSATASGLTATPLNSMKVKLDWTDNAVDEEGYEIESKAWNDRWALIGRVSPNVTTWTQTFSLDPAKTYSYRVRPYRQADKAPYSNVATATTPAYIPGDQSCQ